MFEHLAFRGYFDLRLREACCQICCSRVEFDIVKINPSTIDTLICTCSRVQEMKAKIISPVALAGFIQPHGVASGSNLFAPRKH